MAAPMHALDDRLDKLEAGYDADICILITRRLHSDFHRYCKAWKLLFVLMTLGDDRALQRRSRGMRL